MNKNKGFILTQTIMLVLTFLSLILASASFTNKEKDTAKSQLLPVLQREIEAQTAAENKALTENDFEPGPVATGEQSKGVEIDYTKVKDYYSQVKFSDHAKGMQSFPNDISYTVINENFNGFMAGLSISFNGKWDFPVNWLIKENYIPERSSDFPRLKRVFLCEYREYLYNMGQWPEYAAEKTQCEYFVKLTPEAQYLYNVDMQEQTGNYFFK